MVTQLGDVTTISQGRKAQLSAIDFELTFPHARDKMINLEQGDYKQDILNGNGNGNGNGEIHDTSAPAHDGVAPRHSQLITPEVEEYIRHVEAEIESLGAHGPLVRALAERELSRLRAGEVNEHGYIIVHKDYPVKVIKKVLIPIKEYPNVNFVGRLLGPKGNTLKGLQQATRARILIFGKGSMWDKTKEEEARVSGDPKYAHLNEELHVYVEITAYPVEIQSRFAHVLAELKKFLDPNHPAHHIVANDGPPSGPPIRPPPHGVRGPPPPGYRGPRPPMGPPRGYGVPPRAAAPPPAPAPAYDTTGYYGSGAAQPEASYPPSDAASGYGYAAYPSQADYNAAVAPSSYEGQSQQQQQQPSYAAAAQPTYGAPPQPAYGQPSASQPSAYGQSAAPAYGQSAAPAYGQPPASSGYGAAGYGAQQQATSTAPAGYGGGYSSASNVQQRLQQFAQPAAKKPRLAAPPYGGAY
ncbi:putative KH domain-containing, RNA-binding, signal transduction-associated protein 2 [Hypsibius exemplaris]|uniref:KH domain-containing, RNA-binding, signal transduction-associated protein 2 n=1 Tax=Hypsibius exemplaris TaxID=2072580 RepID=A0A1W0WEB9_HYPEX|nr:putative KH domain-containing, RNA-binding, signal transduction-associated protein 2 [Hypsibius exemplaris]